MIDITTPYRYDPNNPPPQNIVISLEEYDQIKFYIAHLMEIEHLLEIAMHVILGDPSPEVLTKEDIISKFNHYKVMRMRRLPTE